MKQTSNKEQFKHIMQTLTENHKSYEDQIKQGMMKERKKPQTFKPEFYLSQNYNSQLNDYKESEKGDKQLLIQPYLRNPITSID